MSEKKNSLDDALAASFAAPPKKKSVSVPKKSVSKPPKVSAPEVKAPKEPVPSVAAPSEKPKSVGTVKKSTISLYPEELDAVDRILDQLRDEGRVRGGLTDAVRVALRLCPTDPKEVFKAWEESRRDDGRVVRHQK